MDDYILTIYMEVTGDQLAFLFNQYYFEILTKLKSHAKDAIRKHYAKFDRVSDVYSKRFYEVAIPILDAFKARILEEKKDSTKTAETKDEDDDTDEIEFFKGISWFLVKETIEAKMLDQFLAALVIIQALGENKDSEDVVNAVWRVVKEFDSIDKLELPEDHLAMQILKWIDSVRSQEKSKREEENNQEIPSALKETLDKIGSTKIGQLATELSKELSGKPDLGNIGDMVSKVSSKLQSKLQNGEINQNDLLQETMGMMGSLMNLAGSATGSAASGGNAVNPLASLFGGLGGGGGIDLAQMMKSMQSMFPPQQMQQMQQMQPKTSATKVRLANKLLKRAEKKT